MVAEDQHEVGGQQQHDQAREGHQLPTWLELASPHQALFIIYYNWPEASGHDLLLVAEDQQEARVQQQQEQA